MSKPVFLFFYFLFQLSLGVGQENLVPNGSFEEYNNCPSFADGFYIDACKYWTSPTMGSPDYLNSCSVDFDSSLNTYLFSVPQNGYGNQLAKDGDAYAFLYLGQTFDYTQDAYCEYIQVELKKTLEIGKLYDLSFYVHNPITQCSNSLGVLFSNLELNLSIQTIIPSQPQFMSDPNLFFCDTTKWYELKHSFMSDGTEKFMIIGIFKQGNQIMQTDYQGNILLDYFIDAEFYIDDVSLIETAYVLPNVFTPNHDGVNDRLEFLELANTIEKLSILTRWGNLVYQSNQDFEWDGDFNQNQCVDGVYTYVIELKNKNKLTGFVHLVR